ncbi:MAG: T9SS type A sorting domain-containing protein [Bacteroidetes bacterium]|nr:MAG: T9SS type A sorting domain-containing protein [Bacteroidota bacterium]
MYQLTGYFKNPLMNSLLKTCFSIIPLFMSIVPLAGQEAADSVNLAATAMVTTSYVSPWETLGAVKDGYEPSGSADHSHGAYGNWNGEADYGNYHWVQYEWGLAQNVTSSSVYWWDDGLGIDQPTDAWITVWNGSVWSDTVRIGNELNRFNAVRLNFRTNRIRIHMKSLMATGIIEWKVYGTSNTNCTPTALSPFVQAGNQQLKEANTVSIAAGDSVLLGVAPVEGGDWSWSGPGGFTAATRSVTIRDMIPGQSGTYTLSYLNECGAFSYQVFYVTVFSGDDIADPYTWPAYSPNISYNFRDEFPALQEPVQDLEDCPGVVGNISSGWWTFRWGASANPLVTAAAVNPMLERMNSDFAYFRDVMGWPPDKRAKRGYRSAIYLYGSGLCTDNASNTDLGGWQSSISYNGESWPMVLISYYPVYCFDPSCSYTDRGYQTGAVVHEGIHSVLADLPGCRQAAWFHEGGNTWLQQEASAMQSNNYASMGFLNGASFIAPFMPIECYSGWLQDGSFGGPSAEGVNRFDGSTQICTWRNLLGGVQYSNSFPTFLGMTLGNGSIPWIWRYCTGRVLEGMAGGLGDVQIRRLIMEYRAKQALVDMGNWTKAVRDLLDAQFGTQIKAEWQPSWLNPTVWYATPYVRTTNDGNGLLTPEKATTPGWSGANQIPLKVTGNIVTVDFRPLSPNMTCQLCYRSSDGEAIYGNPVYGGECSLRLEKAPANGVVFAVICNTDYIYKGEETRTAHHDYRLQLVEGVTGAADINTKWYQWDRELGSSTAVVDLTRPGAMMVYPNPVRRDESIVICPEEETALPVSVEIWNLSGVLIHRETLASGGSVEMSGVPAAGLYFLVAATEKGKSISKLIVR